MENKEFELYRKTTGVYLKRGIRSVTMDEMAKELRMAKKTMYKYVKDRKELVAKSMEWKLAVDMDIVNKIAAKKLNVIEELLEMSKHHYSNLTKLHPSIHQDLEKYYRDAWNLFIDYRNKFLFNKVLSNIKRGIKDGFYRNDFDMEIISIIYISRVDMVFDARIFPVSKYTFPEVYLEMVKYHISGIVNEKGLKEMKRLMNDDKLLMFKS